MHVNALTRTLWPLLCIVLDISLLAALVLTFFVDGSIICFWGCPSSICLVVWGQGHSDLTSLLFSVTQNLGNALREFPQMWHRRPRWLYFGVHGDLRKHAHTLKTTMWLTPFVGDVSQVPRLPVPVSRDPPGEEGDAGRSQQSYRRPPDGTLPSPHTQKSAKRFKMWKKVTVRVIEMVKLLLLV